MPMERISMDDYSAYGNLIKKWAKDPSTRPTNLDEFKQQVADAGVGMNIPDRLTSLRIIDQKEDILTVVIPLRQMIEDSEALFASGGAYRLPDFYEDTAFHAAPDVADSDKLKFHSSRIGDYTTGQCV